MKQLRVLIFILFCYSNVAVAQEDTSEPPSILNSGSVLLTKAKGSYPPGDIQELWLLDPLRGEQEMFLDLRREGYRIPRVHVGAGGRYIFTLEVEGEADTGFVILGQSQIIRLDLETGEREVVFSGTNITDFTLSPDGSRALLDYFPEDMNFVGRYDLIEQEWCVVELNVDETECRRIASEAEPYPDFEWITNEIIAYTLNYPYAVYLLNADTFDVEAINLPEGVAADEIVRMPQSENFLIYDSPDFEGEQSRLFLLDRSDQSVRQISEFDGALMHMVEVSPNEHFVVAAGHTNGVLIDLQQGGQVIQHYPTIYDMQWVEMQWLSVEHSPILIGRMTYFRTGGELAVVFEANFNVAISVLPPLEGRIIVVP